jgi:hypothetical protein
MCSHFLDYSAPGWYSSPSIIKMIKSRRMIWAEHVARMEDKRNAYRILVGKPEWWRKKVEGRKGG